MLSSRGGSHEILIAEPDALPKRGVRMPAELVDAAAVEQLSRSAVWFAGVEHKFTLETYYISHESGELRDGKIVPNANIYNRRRAISAVSSEQSLENVVRQVHEGDAGICHIFAVEELSSRFAATPHSGRRSTCHPGFVHFTDECRNDVTVGQIVAVAGTIEVGRHDRQELRTVLAIKRPAHFDSGNLGYGVGPIGRLQRTGKKVIFLHGLRTVAWVDAGRAEEQQPLDTMPVRRLNNVVLDGKIDGDEIGRVGIIGVYAPNLGGSEKNVFWFFRREKSLDRSLVGEVEFGVCAGNDVGVGGMVITPPLSPALSPWRRGVF